MEFILISTHHWKHGKYLLLKWLLWKSTYGADDRDIINKSYLAETTRPQSEVMLRFLGNFSESVWWGNCVV